jgi:hypothetical protein
MAKTIRVVQPIVLPPDNSESSSVEQVPTAAQASHKECVTLSRGFEHRDATAQPILSPKFANLAAEIVTPDFETIDDQTYHSTMQAAVTTAGSHAILMGMTLAKVVMPGIEEAARRFSAHKGDESYRLNGQRNPTEYIASLGLKAATIRKWRQRLKEQEQKIKALTGSSGTENEPSAAGKHRDKYDATDSARLERIAHAAEDAAKTNPDDDAFNPVRHAIENKPEHMPEGSSHKQTVRLALEASSIIFNHLGDRLMGTAEGNRLVQIAREILELNRK